MKYTWIVVLGVFSSFANEINWSSPDIIFTPGTNASYPKVAMDADGNTLATWIEDGIVKAVTKLVGGQWSVIETLSGEGASKLTIILDTSGNATTIWLQNQYVQISSMPKNGNWSSPIDVSDPGVRIPAHVKVHLDINGNGLVLWSNSYNGSTYALQKVLQASQYLIYRNGLYVTTLSSEQFQYIDRNQIQNGTVTYGVAATNTSWRQSPTTTVVFS